MNFSGGQDGYGDSGIDGDQDSQNQEWTIFEAQADGSFDWNGQFNVSISDYEPTFGVDIDNGVLTNVAYSEGDLMMLDVSGKATSDGSTALVTFDCNE